MYVEVGSEPYIVTMSHRDTDRGWQADRLTGSRSGAKSRRRDWTPGSRPVLIVIGSPLFRNGQT